MKYRITFEVDADVSSIMSDEEVMEEVMAEFHNRYEDTDKPLKPVDIEEV